MTGFYVGPGTAALREELPDIIAAELLIPYGRRGCIIRQSEPLYGQLEGSETRGPEIPVFLDPAADSIQRAAAGAGLPIPAFTLYVLMRDAPDLGVPGWALEVEGVRYHPTGDARDSGSQGCVWEVNLLSPGQLSDVAV